MKAAGLSNDDIKSYKITFKKEKNNFINKLKDNSSFKEVMETADLVCLIEWEGKSGDCIQSHQFSHTEICY